MGKSGSRDGGGGEEAATKWRAEAEAVWNVRICENKLIFWSSKSSRGSRLKFLRNWAKR